ncbi:MAG: response regulator transcription factor [Acidobacteriota bacterium]|nr:response regulator transcription factor [Acidobacteriota bacterium]
MGQPTIELVGPADLARARVALVVTEAVDQGAARLVKAIERDGIPKVVMVASRFDEAGVLTTVAAGVTNFMRRSEATAARLTEVIRQADSSGCQLPEGLLKKAASVDPPVVTEAVTDTDLGAGGRRSDTLTVCLSTREAEVMRLVADGYDTGDIADQLAYSESTIKGVLAKVMSRLEARNRCHAVAVAVRQGLI